MRAIVNVNHSRRHVEKLVIVRLHPPVRSFLETGMETESGQLEENRVSVAFTVDPDSHTKTAQ